MAKRKSSPAKQQVLILSRERAGGPPTVRARYDAAETTPDNLRHWANADALSADASASPAVRALLRARSRYEIANNGYLKGMVASVADDMVGTGPRLQMMLSNADLAQPEDSDAADVVNSRLEAAFAEWMQVCRLAAKLRTARRSKAADGEAFLQMFSNPELEMFEQLDLVAREADMVTTPVYLTDAQGKPDTYVDGIRFDAFGNPTGYHVLKQHPGSMTLRNLFDYDEIPARRMVHWFTEERPGQHRGIPEVLPSLPLCAYLRRWTLATVNAAETAANWAITVESDLPAGSEPTPLQAMDVFDVERGMMVTLPLGWKAKALQPEQPSTGHAEFKDGILNEIGRPMKMPFNVVAGNSSGYNFASGRLDHLPYYRALGIERYDCGLDVLNPILREWLAEARFNPELADLPWAVIRRLWRRHEWFWDEFEEIDREGAAKADDIRLRNGTLTEAEHDARRGKDWRQRVKQLGVERRAREKEGLPLLVGDRAPNAGPRTPPGDEEAKDKKAEETEK